jgi:hypothetical protein
MEIETAPRTHLPGSLPQGWEQVTDESGMQCFRNGELNLRTYYDPREPNRHSNGFTPTPVDGPPLPTRWEAVRQPGGPLVFLDHNTHSSTTNDPRSSILPGSLPQGWEQITDESGMKCFRNDELNLRTYYDPREPNRHSNGFTPASVDGPPLPLYWEAVRQPGGPLVFLDHNTHSSTTDDPRVSGANVVGGGSA